MPPSEAPAYAPLLKRRPVQRRSEERLLSILDSSAVLIADGGLDALTMRSVANRAGVPTGTIYQSFADRDTLLQALAVRYVSASREPVEAALAGAGPWHTKVENIVDLYARQLRNAPAMRILWLAGVMDDATRRLAADADDQIAAQVGGALPEMIGAAGAGVGADADWRFLVTLISGLLKSAFAVDPSGDPLALERTKRVAILWAADVLGVDPPDPDDDAAISRRT